MMNKLLYCLLLILLGTPVLSAQPTNQVEESLYNTIKWRLIGPFRGGRSGTVQGVINQPNLYYMGTAGGGVWKTTDGGNSWSCISDGYFGGSIGAVAVAPSDPNVRKKA